MSALLAVSANIYFLSPTDEAIILTSGERATPGTECEVVITLLHPEH